MTMQPPYAVGAYEARTHFSELLEKVESGEEITITKHGTPVARLVPIKKELTPAERARLGTQIESLLQKGSFMDDDLLADIIGALT